MFSVPPARTRPWAPVLTAMAASSTACSPEPQRRSTCMPGTRAPSPASSATTRPIAGAGVTVAEVRAKTAAPLIVAESTHPVADG